MSKKILLAILLVLLLILSLTFVFTLWQKNKVEILQDDLVEEFIEVFYQMDDEEMKPENLIDYTNVLENKYMKYFTDKEFGRLVSNRVFYYNQAGLHENGVSCNLVDLEYEKSDLKYEYKASIEFTDKNGEKTIKSTEGYIRLNDLHVIEYAVLGVIEGYNPDEPE